jgi:hypothetical protein
VDRPHLLFADDKKQLLTVAVLPDLDLPYGRAVRFPEDRDRVLLQGLDVRPNVGVVGEERAYRRQLKWNGQEKEKKTPHEQSSCGVIEVKRQ